METRVTTSTMGRTGGGNGFPAYGPVDAALGYWLFYVIVDRATPTVVDLFGGGVLDLSPSLLRLGLATLLWFVLAVTVVDQLRTQFDALNGGEADDRGWLSVSRLVPDQYWLLAYGLAAALAGATALVTFEVGVAAAVTLIESIATFDVAAILMLDVVTVVVFFVSFAVASFSIDRLTIRTVRALLAVEDAPTAPKR